MLPCPFTRAESKVCNLAPLCRRSSEKQKKHNGTPENPGIGN